MKLIPVKSMMNKFLPAAKFTLATVALSTSIANATVIEGSSNAYSLSADVSVSDLLHVDVIAPSGVTGNAPAPYDVNDNVVGVDVELGSGIGVGDLIGVQLAALADNTLLASSANSDVDGISGVRTATASGVVNNLNLDVLSAGSVLTGFEAAIDISSSTLFSTSTVSGDFGNLSALGSSYVENLSINLFGLGELDLATLGLEADVDGFIYADPNFELLEVNGIAGLDLILNEQYGDCSRSICSIGVNALRLSFNAVDITQFGLGSLTGLLDGDIIIGHSYAELTAQANINEVPAPASLGIFSLVMVALGMAKRRRG